MKVGYSVIETICFNSSYSIIKVAVTGKVYQKENPLYERV